MHSYRGERTATLELCDMFCHQFGSRYVRNGCC